MKGDLVFVLLVAGIVCCTAGHHWGYNYLKLVTVWPNSYCIINEDTCRDVVPQSFTIEGLWPIKSKIRDPPQYCLPTYTLQDDDMLNYKYELLKYWPDLTTSNVDENMEMWRDQWKTHGSCSDGPLPPKKYFKRALDRMKDHNLATILSKGGITPSNSTHAAWKIRQVLREGTGFAVDIVCDKKDGQYYLTEIHQCLDYNGNKFINCTTYICNNSTIFLLPPSP